jgi:hypothetical protein
MKPFTANARDAGLALIGRVNRLMLGGAIALTGGLSVAAAKSFHGHQRRAVAVSPPSSRAGSSTAAPSNSGSASSGAGLQAPAQMPAPVQQVPAPVQQAPVVSGGS